MKNTQEILFPDCTYHIYNRANGNEQLFLSEENYRYFLQQYVHYINPIADTFCYCLMPNHFHFLIRIKSEEELETFFKTKLTFTSDLQGFKNLEGLLTQQFSNLFNSYSKAFNKQNARKGSLFMHPYKRVKVLDEHYRQKLVHYIHYNPLEAQLCNSLTDWKYSSYTALNSARSTVLLRDEVISWFDDLANFNYVHLHPPTETGIDFI